MSVAAERARAARMNGKDLVEDLVDLVAARAAGAKQTPAAQHRLQAVRRVILQRLGAIPYTAAAGDRTCVKCGCTDSAACPQGCGWAVLDPNVCTSCVASILYVRPGA